MGTLSSRAVDAGDEPQATYTNAGALGVSVGIPRKRKRTKTAKSLQLTAEDHIALRVDHGNTASALFPRQKCGSAMKAKTASQKNFVLQKVQPALLGLMDGAVSTLAPIFAVAGLTGKPENAFFVGLAASLGAGVSMGLAEALSDDGIVTGRGGPILRGSITGIATAIGGMLHTFPFLISNLSVALNIAYAVVVGELLAIAFIRYRFMSGNLWTTIGQVIVGGGIVFGIGIWLGRIGAS